MSALCEWRDDVDKKQEDGYVDVSNDCWLHSSHGGLEEHAHLDIS